MVGAADLHHTARVNPHRRTRVIETLKKRELPKMSRECENETPEHTDRSERPESYTTRVYPYRQTPPIGTLQRWELESQSVVGGTCHKYNFCRYKSMLVATKLIFVATNILILSQQNICRNKLTFVAINTCLSRQ